MGSTPHHIANRPRGPSVPLMRMTAAQSKHCQTTQHLCNGVKVHCPLPHLWGTCPPLLIPYAQGKPPCCAEVHDADFVVWPGYHPLTTTMMHRHHDDRDRRPPATSPPFPCPPGPRAQALRTSVRGQLPHSQCSRATTHQQP